MADRREWNRETNRGKEIKSRLKQKGNERYVDHVKSTRICIMPHRFKMFFLIQAFKCIIDLAFWKLFQILPPVYLNKRCISSSVTFVLPCWNFMRKQSFCQDHYPALNQSPLQYVFFIGTLILSLFAVERTTRMTMIKATALKGYIYSSLFHKWVFI